MTIKDYLDDIWAIISLKDDTYKKIGNDKDALRRYFVYYLVIGYIITLIVGLTLGVFFVIAAGSMGFMSVSLAILLTFAGIIVLPWIGLLFDIVGGLLNHILALIFGGKAKNFWDFYKVYHYARPAIRVIAMIPFVNLAAQFYYMIWDFSVLYKSLRTIHMMDKNKAGWVIGIKIFLYIVMFGVMIYVYLALIVGGLITGTIAEIGQAPPLGTPGIAG